MRDSARNRNEMALLAQAGDRQALNALVVSFQRDIANAANAIGKGARMMEVDDLQQLGYECLLEMVPSWDQDKAPFEAYFRMGLIRRLKRKHYAEQSGPIKFPINVQAAIRAYHVKLDCEQQVTVEEVAKSYGVDPELLEVALEIDANLEDAIGINLGALDATYSDNLDSAFEGAEVDDVTLVEEVREYGVAGYAVLAGLSEWVVRRRFQEALSRIAHPTHRIA